MFFLYAFLIPSNSTTISYSLIYYCIDFFFSQFLVSVVLKSNGFRAEGRGVKVLCTKAKISRKFLGVNVDTPSMCKLRIRLESPHIVMCGVTFSFRTPDHHPHSWNAGHALHTPALGWKG